MRNSDYKGVLNKKITEYAEILLLETFRPPENEKDNYFTSEGSKKNYFGTLLVTMFEKLVYNVLKKTIILLSLPKAYDFYRKLGYRSVDEESFHFYDMFIKDLSNGIPNAGDPEWHKVFSERRQKLTNKVARALLLTRGNVAAAAQLVFYKILART